MISRGVLVWLGIAILTGIGLFLIKYQVRDLEEHLMDLNRRIVDNQESTRILKAEWANLNDLERIEKLSDKYLKLQPVATSQLGTIDALPFRQQAAPDAVAGTPRFDSIGQLLKHAEAGR